jgi:hypothetical protein
LRPTMPAAPRIRMCNTRLLFILLWRFQAAVRA